jgi:undecaprenyl-diphosphatase
MNILAIFGAKYLYLIEIVLVVIYFFLQTRSKQKSIVVLSAIFFPLTYIVAKAVSFLYFDPRPFVVGHFTPLIAHAPDNGFPSDHMLLTCAIASILFVYNKKLGVIAWIIAFIIGASRVFVGVHHWIDIVGSVVIVVCVMWLVKRYVLPEIAKTKFYKRYFEK